MTSIDAEAPTIAVLAGRGTDSTWAVPCRSSIQNDGRAWCTLSFMPSLDEVKAGLLQILESNGYNVSGITGDSLPPDNSAAAALAIGVSDKWNFNVAVDEVGYMTLDTLAALVAD